MPVNHAALIKRAQQGAADARRDMNEAAWALITEINEYLNDPSVDWLASGPR